MIEACDLTKHYKGHSALNGLSLSVPDGSAFLVVGENGAGKTTLIKVLMNLLQPSSGTASIMGVDTRRLSPKELTHVGYVAEDQIFAQKLRVREYLAYLRTFYPTWDKSFEKQMLRNFGLPEERLIGELSHGMRMKLALTSSLSYRPKLLILDEPLNGLDPLVRDEFMEGLAGFSQGVTILMSSHELGDTETFATHVAFMDNGRLIFQESIETLLSRFRSVRIVFDSTARFPEILPPGWIDPGQHGNVLSFVHSQFTEANLARQLHERCKGVKGVEASPLPLRSIFTSLSRSIREHKKAGA